MFGCARIALGERVRPLLERARRAIHGAEEPRLEAADRIDALVEEALLVAAGVLVDRGDAVLVDRDLRAAIGGGEHGLAEHVAGLVVAPQERADLDRLLGVAHALDDRWNAASPEPSTRSEPPSIGVDTACSGAGSPTALHLPHAPRAATADGPNPSVDGQDGVPSRSHTVNPARAIGQLSANPRSLRTDCGNPSAVGNADAGCALASRVAYLAMA